MFIRNPLSSPLVTIDLQQTRLAMRRSPNCSLWPTVTFLEATSTRRETEEAVINPVNQRKTQSGLNIIRLYLPEVVIQWPLLWAPSRRPSHIFSHAAFITRMMEKVTNKEWGTDGERKNGREDRKERTIMAHAGASMSSPFIFLNY